MWLYIVPTSKYVWALFRGALDAIQVLTFHQIFAKNVYC